ncbi:hypothetical protein CALVIDRAFT_599829 [Calocera viscosa TUFC12733]|uniref:DUF6533 domain-containing protein n=1 Tax=Calocera viscosa (strain TUFC12733) TaxID=1330018 RepID=A0A167KAA2_CALVF|nr:hypothetical protein CALVIDRAFT_599829 [Calocera viscosa TUFC12733]
MSNALSAAELQNARDAQAYCWSSMAAFALILYDTVIAMDQEVIHIWRAKWSPTKVLYLLSRYVTIFGVLLWWLSTLQSLSTTPGPSLAVGASNPPHASCRTWSIMSGIGLLITGVSVDLIQLLRIRAVYSVRRYVTIPLYLMFAGVFLAALLVVVVSQQDTTVIPNTAFEIGCLDNPDNTGTLVAWIGEMCLGAVFFALTLAKLHPYLRGGQMSALTAIVQGGVIYYAVIFAVELINVMFLQLVAKGSRPNLAGITQPWTLAVYGIAGPRLVLHLKGVISPAPVEWQDTAVKNGAGESSSSRGSDFPSQIGSAV